MGLKIYKPNGRKTGHACHFQLTAAGEGQGVYLDMVKQTGWDNSQKKGSFKGGDQIKVKFNSTEAAAMVDSVLRDEPIKLFHKSDQTGSTSINFGPYINKEKVHMGHSLAVKRGEKSFLMGFTHAERTELRIWLEEAVRHIHLAEYAADKKRRKENYDKRTSQNEG